MNESSTLPRVESRLRDSYSVDSNSLHGDSFHDFVELNHAQHIFESNEQEIIFHQISEIFPNENPQKLHQILKECKWSMELSVVRLLDQDNSRDQSVARSTSAARHSLPHDLLNLDGKIPTIPRFKSQTKSRGVRELLPSGFLEIPKVRTVLVSPPTHLANVDYHEYKVYFHRKNRSLDINVKLVDRSVRICGLYPNPEGGPGLSELAGVQIGDIFYGINHEYFDNDISLKQVTTVLSRSGPFVCCHFIRFPPNSLSTVANGQIRRTHLRKIHPCALSIIDQGILNVGDVESFCEDLCRLKSRIFSWSSGILTSRQKILDLLAVTHGELYESNSRDENFARQFGRNESTKGNKKLRRQSSSSISNQSRASSDSAIANITKNWYRDIELTTANLQPALCLRIMDNRFIGGHVEYRIWVEDISTGLEWFVRRRFKEFFKLRENLISIWGRFSLIPFPAKTAIAAVGSTADIVHERQPVLERFLRTVYQIIVTEPSVHPLTRDIYLLLYNFLDISDYLPAIESLVSLQSTAHGAYMNQLLFLTQDVTIEPAHLLYASAAASSAGSGNSHDPLLYTRRFIELYIHSVLQLNIFSTKVIDKFIHNFVSQSHDYIFTSLKNETIISKGFVEKMLGNLSEIIHDIQEVLVVGMRDDILELIEFLIHGNIQGRYAYHTSSPPPTSAGASTNVITSCDEIECVLESIEGDGNGNGIRLRNDIIETISRIAIRRQIEKEVYIPCSISLHDIMQKTFQSQEQEFIAKCHRLLSQPQSFYGIPTHSISPSSWEEVVNSLSRLQNQYIPSDKLQLLVTSAKLIPVIYAKEHMSAGKGTGTGTSGASKSLGADDLLPIFIYCLVMSRLSHHLLIISQELDSLCDNEDRVSETGYYLATLQAAIFHIMEIDETVGDRMS